MSWTKTQRHLLIKSLYAFLAGGGGGPFLANIV